MNKIIGKFKYEDQEHTIAVIGDDHVIIPESFGAEELWRSSFAIHGGVHPWEGLDSFVRQHGGEMITPKPDIEPRKPGVIY